MKRTSTEAVETKRAPSIDDRVGHQLRRAYQTASANLARRLQGSGLSVPRFTVLARLNEFGALSQNHLGRLVAMEPANIHDMVRAMAAQGLLEIRRDPDDGRRRLVALSGTGKALIDKVQPLSEEANEATLAPLSASERKTLMALLRRIAANE